MSCWIRSRVITWQQHELLGSGPGGVQHAGVQQRVIGLVVALCDGEALAKDALGDAPR